MRFKWMRFFVAAAAFCAAGSVCSSAADVQSEVQGEMMELPVHDAGVTFRVPENDSLPGGLNAVGGDLAPGQGFYYARLDYTGVSDDVLDAVLSGEDYPEEYDERISACTVPVLMVVGLDEKYSASDVADTLNYLDASMELSADDVTEAARAENLVFYRVDFGEYESYKNLDLEFADAYDQFAEMADSIVEASVFEKPASPFDELIGKKVSFETKDLDGNVVKSEDLFAENKVTMVNVWATWCIYCREELPELAEINKELAEDGCGIVGLLGDGTDESIVAAGKDMLDEAGCDYVNLLPYDGWEDDFNMSMGWPTSFFVDSEGRITADPIFGARIDEYADHVREAAAALEDKGEGEMAEAVTEAAGEAEQAEAVSEAAGEAEQAETDSKEAWEDKYTVRVTDKDSNPVEGAMIQFCTSDTCKVNPTNADGAAEFDEVPGVYEIHVLMVPDGFKQDDTVYKTAEDSGSMTIVLDKE